MKYHLEKKYLYWGITAFLVIAASMLFYFSLFHTTSLKQLLNTIYQICSPLIFGAVIAYLLNTLVRFLEEKLVFRFCKWRKIKITAKTKKAVRAFCVFFAVIIAIWGIYALMAMLVPQLFSSVINIVEHFPRYVDTIQTWIANTFQDNPDLRRFSNEFFENVESHAQTWMNSELLPGINALLRNFSSGVFGILNFLKNVLIGLVISIYLLYGKENFIARGKQFMYSMFRIESVNNIIRDLQFVNNMFGSYLIGAVVDSLIIGVLCYAGMSIFQMPYAVLISVIVGVTNIIPFFGPYLGAVPSTFLILLINPIQALYFALFILVLQQFDGNVLKPRIFGNSTGLSSFLVITAIIIGGGLFGIFGMFVGVPVCAIICTIVRNRILRRLAQKKLPEELEYYQDIDHLDSKTQKPVLKNCDNLNKQMAFQYKKKNEAAKP
jgi:Predicted permease